MVHTVTRKDDPFATLFCAPRPNQTSHVSRRQLLESVLALRQPVIDKSWEAVSRQALLSVGLGHTAFRRLQDNATRASTLDAAYSRIPDRFSDLLMAVATSRQRDGVVQALRDKLAESDAHERLDRTLSDVRERVGGELPADFVAKVRAAARPAAERIDIEDSFEKLLQGKTKGVSLLGPFTIRSGSILTADIERKAEFAVLCLCRGLLAFAHSEFNLALRSVSAPPGSAAFDNVHDAIQQVVEDMKTRLECGQRSVYAALVTQRPMWEVASAATTLAGEIERSLPSFVRSQAAMRLTMLGLRTRGKGTASEKIGHLAADAGMLLREAVASHCASMRLALSVLQPERSKDFKAVVERAGTTAFNIELPHGRNTPLKDLVAADDGAFVEIEGFVDDVTAQRVSGKLVSHARLVDPSSGAIADAIAIFAHLPHAGVTIDSFCRLSGVYRTESAEFGGKPAVEIDALALAELAEASWRIGFLRLAERWFEPWRNRANFYWSLGPHGTGDDGVGRFGAGELLFLPLIRR